MEWSFEGTRGAVLLDPEDEFRRLETRDGSRACLFGSWIEAGPEALAEPSRLPDVFGRYLLLVHDPRQRTLTVRTDRYGAVPFYGCQAGGRLVLARRLRTLAAAGIPSGRVDGDGLANLLAFGRTLGPRTLLAGVEALERGRTTIDLDSGAVRREVPWNPATVLGGERVPLASVEDELVGGFLDAVETCVAGGKEIAITLSGGMDTRCLLAALLARGQRPSAYHVSVPGSRAADYTRRIAARCGIPFHPFGIDAAFAARYYELLGRVVRESSATRMAPQVEMLWLRDQLPEGTITLHGAFGELAKLRELRDYRLDDAALGMERGQLLEHLWTRYQSTYRQRLRILAPELRALLECRARTNLGERLAALPSRLGTPDALQLLYLEEFLRSSRLGHQLWNERVDARFPFVHPSFLDVLLRVRNEDRLEQRFQPLFLERVDPRLRDIPDENTGTRANAPLWWQRLVGTLDRVATLLRGRGVESGHGDLLHWLTAMEPSLEAILEGRQQDEVFDLRELRAMVAALRASQTRSGLRRGLAARAVREQALALQTFLILHLSRETLGWSP